MALIRLNNQSISSVTALPSGIDVGKIGQVVEASTSTEDATTSTSFVNSSISVTITPTSTSSKIYVIASANAYTSASGYSSYYNLYRGGVTGTRIGTQARIEQTGYLLTHVVLQALDSPSTTSAVTYTVGHRSQSSSAESRLQIGSDAASNIIAMEVLA